MKGLGSFYYVLQLPPEDRPLCGEHNCMRPPVLLVGVPTKKGEISILSAFCSEHGGNAAAPKLVAAANKFLLKISTPDPAITKSAEHPIEPLPQRYTVDLSAETWMQWHYNDEHNTFAHHPIVVDGLTIQMACGQKKSAIGGDGIGMKYVQPSHIEFAYCAGCAGWLNAQAKLNVTNILNIPIVETLGEYFTTQADLQTEQEVSTAMSTVHADIPPLEAVDQDKWDNSFIVSTSPDGLRYAQVQRQPQRAFVTLTKGGDGKLHRVKIYGRNDAMQKFFDGDEVSPDQPDLAQYRTYCGWVMGGPNVVEATGHIFIGNVHDECLASEENAIPERGTYFLVENL